MDIRLQALQRGEKVKVVFADQDYTVVAYTPDKGVYEVEGDRGLDPSLRLVASDTPLGEALVQAITVGNSLERLEGTRFDILDLAAKTNSAQKVTATTLRLAAKRLAELAQDSTQTKSLLAVELQRQRRSEIARLRAFKSWDKRKARSQEVDYDDELLEIGGDELASEAVEALEQGHSVELLDKPRVVQMTLW